MIWGLFEEGSDVYRLVTEVPNGLHPGGVLLPQVLEVLVRRLVLGVVHLDRAGVDQLRGEILDLGRELEIITKRIYKHSK